MVRAGLRKRGIRGYAQLVPYLLVLGLSLLVGFGVYSATVRAEREAPALGFGDDPETNPAEGTAPSAGPGYSYLRVSTEGPSMADRMLGFIGTIVLVALGAAVLALAIYLGGRLVNLLIESFLGS
jgi:hypothetical protein